MKNIYIYTFKQTDNNKKRHNLLWNHPKKTLKINLVIRKISWTNKWKMTTTTTKASKTINNIYTMQT